MTQNSCISGSEVQIHSPVFSSDFALEQYVWRIFKCNFWAKTLEIACLWTRATREARMMNVVSIQSHKFLQFLINNQFSSEYKLYATCFDFHSICVRSPDHQKLQNRSYSTACIHHCFVFQYEHITNWWRCQLHALMH